MLAGQAASLRVNLFLHATLVAYYKKGANIMTYTDQEKTAIITQYQQGKPIQELCAEYSVCVRTIYRWAKLYCPAVPDERRTCTVKEYDALLHKVSKLENMVAVLQTVGCTVHAPLKERLTELELLYGQYDVHTLCEALNVPRGTFYNHILRNKRSNAWFEKRREEYRILIQKIFDEYRQVLGAEKIRTILVQHGHQVSTEYVAKLMREMGLASIRSTAKQDYMKLHEPEKKRNILQQQFQADKPNQIWVSDVTCFKLGEFYLYTCVILDLFSRKIVAYKVSRKNSTQLITSTFKMAWAQRNPETKLIFHSDRGAQYTSHRFKQLLHEHAVVQSFSNSGRPHDNAVAESFFATLKKEELYRKDYTSETDFKRCLASYIEFYNTQRPHRTLKNRTPCQVEELFMNGK